MNSQSPITDVGASASQVAGSLPPVETTNFDTETFRREEWILCGAAMSDDDACPWPRLCTEHFDLAADDSQDEVLADGMHGCELACPCRTVTPHRVMIGYTARRWPVRRRERAMRGTPLDSNEQGDPNHGRQDRSLCGVGRLH